MPLGVRGDSCPYQEEVVALGDLFMILRLITRFVALKSLRKEAVMAGTALGCVVSGSAISSPL